MDANQNTPNHEAWYAEINEKSTRMDEHVEAISDSMGFSSTLVVAVLPLDRKVRTKIVSFDGSLFELVSACREFIRDFEEGMFCGDGGSESNAQEDGDYDGQE